MIQLRSLSWSLAVFALGCIFLSSSSSPFAAASYGDSNDLQRVGSLPGVVYLYPSDSVISEKLSPAHARLDSLLAAQPYGFQFQKKFDSLSGGTFGKRQYQ